MVFSSVVWLLSVEVNRGRDGQREAYDDCDDEWDLNQGRYEHGVLRVVWLLVWSTGPRQCGPARRCSASP